MLTKYYSDPSKYRVTDGRLERIGFWGVQIDNNHPDYVVVFLGDLGRDIPVSEQSYWKSFNVAPEGKMSKVMFDRSFLGEFSEPMALDLVFKTEIESFIKDMTEAHGWSALKALSQADEHYLDTLHLPVNSSEKEFEAEINALNKILVESINDEELRKKAPSDIFVVERDGQKHVLKGINKLAAYFKHVGIEEYDEHIAFLKLLNILRQGVGHRKNDDYRSKMSEIGYYKHGSIETYRMLLEKAVVFIRFLRSKLI